MTPRPDLSVLIVSYNTCDRLARCLASLPKACAEHSYEVIVADNASADGSLAMLRRDWPDVAVVEMGSNTGFARATNRAMGQAQGRYVLLLNSDTEALPGSLDVLIAFLEATPSAGVAAPKLLNADFTDQGTARAFPTAASALFGRKALLTWVFPQNRWARRYMIGRHRHSTAPFRVDWVSGACLVVPRAVVERVGSLDEGFFMYWEDADWCRRISGAGFSVYCVPQARVIHHEGQSERVFGGAAPRRKPGRPPRLVWVFHQSAYRYFAKYHAPQVWNPLRPIAAIALAGRAALIIATNELRPSSSRSMAATRPGAAASVPKAR
jgi:GT2 family glycosyltransferase